MLSLGANPAVSCCASASLGEYLHANPHASLVASLIASLGAGLGASLGASLVANPHASLSASLGASASPRVVGDPGPREQRRRQCQAVLSVFYPRAWTMHPAP